MQGAQKTTPTHIRAVLWKEAEQYFKQSLNASEKLSPKTKSGLLNAYAILKSNQSEYSFSFEEKNKLLEQAYSMFSEAYRIFPQNTGLLRNLALVLRKQADISPFEQRHSLRIKSEKLLEQFLNINPTDLDALHILADLKCEQADDCAPNEKQKLQDSALETLRKAHSFSPQDLTTIRKISNILCTQAIESTYDKKISLLDEAEKTINLAISINKNNADNLRMLAHIKWEKSLCFQEKEKETLQEEATNLLFRAQELEPQRLDIIKILIRTLVTQAEDRDCNESESLLKKAEKITLETAIPLDPNNHELLNILANIKMQQAKISPQEESKYLYEESASILKNILIETPNDTNTLVQLGILKYNQEKYGGNEDKQILRSDAIKYFERALEVSPQDIHIINRFVSVLIFYIENSELKESIPLYHKAEKILRDTLEIEPTSVQNLCDLSLLLGNKLGKQDSDNDECTSAEVIRLFRNAHYLSPNNFKISRNLILALYEKFESETIENKNLILKEIRNVLYKIKKTDNSLKTYKETLIIFLVAKSKIARQEKCKNAYLMQAEKIIHQQKEKNPEDYYSLACLAALRKDTDKAMEYLEICRKLNGLPPRHILNKDRDLEVLRASEKFLSFVERVYPEE